MGLRVCGRLCELQAASHDHIEAGQEGRSGPAGHVPRHEGTQGFGGGGGNNRVFCVCVWVVTFIFSVESVMPLCVLCVCVPVPPPNVGVAAHCRHGQAGAGSQ